MIRVTHPRILEDRGKRCPRHVQARCLVISDTNFRQDTKSLGITLVAVWIVGILNQLVQRFFADMSKWGMTLIVGKACGLDHLRVNTPLL